MCNELARGRRPLIHDRHSQASIVPLDRRSVLWRYRLFPTGVAVRIRSFNRSITIRRMLAFSPDRFISTIWSTKRRSYEAMFNDERRFPQTPLRPMAFPCNAKRKHNDQASKCSVTIKQTLLNSSHACASRKQSMPSSEPLDHRRVQKRRIDSIPVNSAATVGVACRSRVVWHHCGSTAESPEYKVFWGVRAMEPGIAKR